MSAGMRAADFGQAPDLAEAVASASGQAMHVSPRVEPEPFDPDLWRAVEGTASPYQRLDWVRAYAEAFAEAERFHLIVVSLRGRAGEVAALLPLALRRRHGLAVAAPLGGRHANYHMPAAGNAAGAALPAHLAEIGCLIGADALLFANVPRVWDGRPMPLAASGRPSPSNGYELALQPTAEATLRAALSKDARKKLRQKAKHLAEIGPVRHMVARTAGEAEAVLTAFLAQKAARFAKSGIHDPFASPAARAFLHEAALSGLEGGRPAIELHALVAGERVVAAFGAAADARRCAGMFISFDADPAVARCSPGDLLLTHVIEWCCVEGRARFDLGVGEARYKSSFCPEVIELADVAVPVTARGRAYLSAAQAASAAKRWVKTNPFAWKTVTLARRLRAGAPS